MKASKASGHNGFSTCLIQFSDALIDPLVSIIYMSLSEGIFQIYLKKLMYVLLTKRVKSQNVRTIDLFLYFRILVNFLNVLCIIALRNF